MIVLKSKSEIKIMREAGRINARVLAEIREAVKPGVTTAKLDAIAEKVQKKHDAESVFKGYSFGGQLPPFPTTITACINDELVHGFPRKEPLKDGDLLSIDCASLYNGYIGDSAFSMVVGESTPEIDELLEVTEKSLYKGIEQAKPGNRVGDVSAAIQKYVESFGLNVVRGYGGHGVGRTMHEDPHVPNYGVPKKGVKLRPGMTFAIEPMVLQGDMDVVTLSDRWTVASKDGKLTAHFEHTIAVTGDGPKILTEL